jgi:hypothetical protein
LTSQPPPRQQVPGMTQDELDEMFDLVRGILDVVQRVIRRRLTGRATEARIVFDDKESP